MSNNIILEVENIVKTFPAPSAKAFEKRKMFTAVKDVSFRISKGETLGLIGESGCGKTTVGRIVARLLDADSGRIIFENRDITSISRKEAKSYKNKIQMIFQNPSTALNPQFRIERILKETMKSIDINNKEEQLERILSLISKVGMGEEYLKRYPHELSGGQKQRICILSALLTKPTFIVADEIVSSLDLSVRAQILNLMRSLQEEFNFSTLFISHDLNVIHYMSDKIIVMYMGEVVESGPCETIYGDSRHPYTKLLLSSLLDIKESKAVEIKGEDSCIFAHRCSAYSDLCRIEKPGLVEIGPDHFVRCHFVKP